MWAKWLNILNYIGQVVLIFVSLGKFTEQVGKLRKRIRNVAVRHPVEVTVTLSVTELLLWGVIWLLVAATVYAKFSYV